MFFRAREAARTGAQTDDEQVFSAARCPRSSVFKPLQALALAQHVARPHFQAQAMAARGAGGNLGEQLGHLRAAG